MSIEDKLYGKYRGTVTSPVDVENNGKLTALITVGGQPTPVVAEACPPFAGVGAGWFAMPPPGSGVWIEFEEGDIRRPLWTGCWWPKGQALAAFPPPIALQQLPVILQTIVGNRLVLSSMPGEAVALETKLGKLGPRIAISNLGITLSVPGTASIELAADGVKINGNALTVKPPIVGKPPT